MNEKVLRIISFAALADSFLYALIIFFLHKNNSQHSMQFTSQWYFALIPAFVILFAAGSFREKFWDFQKKRGVIKSQVIFFQKLFTVTVITLAIVENLGVLGLVIFILTGNLNLSVFLVVLSFVGKLINFPTDEYINNKKRELNFPPT